MVKTAGEVRFIKDNSGDASAWAFSQVGPSERDRSKSFEYDGGQLEPLAECLLSTTAAMAHAMRAYERFNNVRSSEVSPDGKLGGRGYIQNIKEMRKQFTNIVEALSSISDTIYDEIQAPYWAQLSRAEEGNEEGGLSAPVGGLVSRTEEIREDPEKWVADDLQKMEREEAEKKRPKKRIKRKTKDEKEEKEEAEKKEKEEAEKKEKEEAEKKEKEEAEKKKKKEKRLKEKAEKKKELEEERLEEEKLEEEKLEEEKRLKEEKDKIDKEKKKISPKDRDKELKKMNRTPYKRK